MSSVTKQRIKPQLCTCENELVNSAVVADVGCEHRPSTDVIRIAGNDSDVSETGKFNMSLKTIISVVEQFLFLHTIYVI